MKESSVQCTNVLKSNEDEKLKWLFTQCWVDVINTKEEKKSIKSHLQAGISKV